MANTAIDVWEWTKQTATNAWSTITKAAVSVGEWIAQAKTNIVSWGKPLIASVNTFLKKKVVRVVKGFAGFAWGMYKAGSSIVKAVGVNAVPLPAISQAASLGYAAKAGYHLSSISQFN